MRFLSVPSMRLSRETRDTLWLMGLQGVNYLAPLLVWPYLMVVLEAEQFGVFSFGIALAQYLMMLVDFGFNLTATKQIALARGDAQETNRIFSATMASKMLLLAVSAGVVFVISLLPVFTAYRPVLWIVWLMVLGNAFSMLWLFQGAGKIRLAAIINAVMKLLILPFTFVFVHTPGDVQLAAWIQVAVYIGSGVVMMILTYALRLARYVRIKRSDVYAQLRGSWSIFLSHAATSTYTALFVVISAYFVSAEEVGCYAAAEKMMRCVCYFVWLPLSQAFFPKVSRLGASDKTEGQRLVQRLTFVVALVLGVAGVLLALGAEPVNQWLGKDYAGIGRLTSVLAIVPVLVGVGGMQGQMGLIALGGESENTAFRNVYLTAGLIALVAVCILSWQFGIIGTAWALVVTEGFVCLSMCALRKRRWRII